MAARRRWFRWAYSEMRPTLCATTVALAVFAGALVAAAQGASPSVKRAAATTTTTSGSSSSPRGKALPLDPTVSTIAPICGDQDGSETPVVTNCSQFSQVVDRRYYQVSGGGSAQVHFDYVYREAALAYELAVFKVDDTSGSINGVLPGDASWPSQVASRNPRVVFALGSNAFTPDVDLAFQGGDILALRYAGNGHTFYSFEQANAGGADHMLAFQHSSGQPWQFAWDDDGFGFPDNDFNDMIVNISASAGAGGEPTEQSYGPSVCRTGRGIHARSATHCSPNAPVNTLTGAFSYAETDLSLAGIGVTFAFERSYTSADTTSGRLGPGWTDSYSASLSVLPNGNVVMHGEDGQRVTYTRQADGSFLGAPGADSTLTAVTGGYQLLTREQINYQFSSAGVLQSTRDRNNQGLTFTYTGGLLTGITDAANRTIVLAYNAGLLSSVSVPDGRTVSYGYTNGLLTSVTLPDPDGSGGPLPAPVTHYTYQDIRLATVVDPNGHTVYSNVYNATSTRVTTLTDANDTHNTTTGYAWDPATQTATITDAREHVWKDVYQNGALLKTIDATNKATVFGHADGALNVTSVTSPNGNDTTTMTYDPAGNLKAITAPASLGGVQKRFTYTALNDVETATDALGHVTLYGYVAGSNTSITLDGVPVVSFTYKPNGQLETSTDGNGKTTTYTYDPNGNVASIAAPDPDGTGPLAAPKTTYTYWDSGLVKTMIAALGNCTGCTASDYATSYTYDNDGRLLTETDPLGNCATCNPAEHTTTHTYDAAGNETSVNDPNGHTTTYEYNNANQVVKTTGPDPDGTGPLEAPVTTYTYDDVGNRLTIVDPRGNCTSCDPGAHTTTYGYDANNRLASVTTPKGEITTYGYDDDGNLATSVEPRGNLPTANPLDYTTTNGYDAAGRIRTVTLPDPDGTGPQTAPLTSYGYDDVGNPTIATDANSHTTVTTYYPTGRVHAVFAPDPDGTGPLDAPVTSYTYDGNDNLKTRTDANNHTTTYGYDDDGRLSTVTGPDPDGTGPLNAPVTTYSYDANGNLATKTDPNGNATPTLGDGTTTYSYDPAGRLTGINYSDATPAVSFTYDAAGNRKTMSDSAGTVSYAYDALDRLTSSTRGSDAFSYTYDPAGNLANRTYPDTTTTNYSYDEDNRLASAASGSATTTYGYDEASHLKQTTLPTTNGYTETRVYDRTGRLTEVKNANATSTLSDYAATLDPVGNPTQTAQTGASPSTTTYGYDAIDRITSVCFQAGSCANPGDPFIRWSYDPVGNRLTEQRPATPTTSYTYNAADELTQTSVPPTALSYPAQAQADGAQPYWRLGELSGTSFASTVGSYTGTWSPSNAPPARVSGALTGDTDKAVTLNGTSQYGTVADSNQLDKTTSFSLELWVKRTKNQSTQAIFGKPLTTTTANENYALWFDNANKLRFEVGNGTNKNAKLTSASALDTNWHHVVATFALGAMKLYIDGALSSSMTASGFTAAGANASTLDVGRAGTTSYYGGSLDELAIYGTALTAAQIADHRNKGVSPPGPTVTAAYAYDDNGNQTGRGDTPFTYDLENRVTRIGVEPPACPPDCLAGPAGPQSVTSQSNTTLYSYDGDGNRSHSDTYYCIQGDPDPICTLNGSTNYLWDTNNDLSQLALERDGSGSLVRRYTYGAQRISMRSGGTDFYYHYDTLGSVSNLTSASGASEWTYSYEPYGTTRTTTQNDPGAPANPMQFTGEYIDPSGLYNLRAREYDSATGRFLERDPVSPPGEAPSTSGYVYASDRPTVFNDPSGERPTGASDGAESALLASSPADAPVGVPRFPWELFKKLIDRLAVCIDDPDCHARIEPGDALRLLIDEGDRVAKRNAASYIDSFVGQLYLVRQPRHQTFYRYYSNESQRRGNFVVGTAVTFANPYAAQQALDLKPRFNQATLRQVVEVVRRGALSLRGKIKHSNPKYWPYGEHLRQNLLVNRNDHDFGPGMPNWWKR
jgi:RHS repeat-associated protein